MSVEFVCACLPFLGVWAKWREKAIRSVRKRGVIGTLRFAVVIARARWASSHAVLRWHRYLDERFDRRLAVDTADILVLPELQSDPQYRYSERYDPTPHSMFFRLLRQVNVDFSRFIFIDFGCGKGRALLLASELPFKQIIGIELSSKLILMARDNLKNYLRVTRKSDIFQLTCMDAGEFQVPLEPAVCYFYNPFGAEVMARVIEKIRASFAAVPREIYIVYLCPVHRSLLDESGFLTPISQTSWYSIHKASQV